MLLAIDVGNTHTVYGLWDGDRWRVQWRRETDPYTTEDELGGWLRSMFSLEDIPWKLDRAICASVSPPANEALSRMCERYFQLDLRFLTSGEAVGLVVDYKPPTSVGADRIANALGALERYTPPVIVVDFGTGTNFDVIDAEGRYLGGAIMPGILVGSEALFKKAAKLPHVEGLSLKAPDSAVGKSTVHSLQSGIVLGYKHGIDGLVKEMIGELGGTCTVVATGGLGGMFKDLCETIQEYEPTLTLDGLRVASERLA